MLQKAEMSKYRWFSQRLFMIELWFFFVKIPLIYDHILYIRLWGYVIYFYLFNSYFIFSMTTEFCAFFYPWFFLSFFISIFFIFLFSIYSYMITASLLVDIFILVSFIHLTLGGRQLHWYNHLLLSFNCLSRSHI